MKVHYLEYDNMVTIFAVVSKKRTNFDNKNIVCVRSYDMDKYNRVNFQSIPEDGIMDIDDAREVWNRWIKFANRHNYKITISESIYKIQQVRTCREPMMDSEVCDAMGEIATKKLTGLQQGK